MQKQKSKKRICRKNGIMILRDIRRMKNLKLFYIILFLLFSSAAWSQEIPEYDWWSLPLMSRPNLIQSYPMFHGYTVGWRPKGLHQNMQLFDGVDFNSSVVMSPYYEWFRHLQFNAQSISFDKDFAERSILRNANAKYLQYSLQNNIYKNTSMFQIKTEQSNDFFHWGFSGVLLRKWNANDWLGPQEQQGLQWYISHRSKNKWHWVVQYSANHQLRAIQSATAKEVYEMMRTYEYNPSWGWYHGQMFFADTKELTSHVAQFTMEKKYSPVHWLRFSAASVLLHSSRQSLTWTQARDPRPDYFRYLPSYQKDSTSYHQLFNYLAAHPQKLQFDFDQIEKINQQSSNGIAKYVIDRNIEKGLEQRVALQWHVENQHHFTFHSRVQLGWDQLHNTHQLVDLLGGKTFSNRLQWINESESGNDFVANVADTSMLHLGSEWGPNYSLQSKSVLSHNELSLRWYKGEWSFEWWNEMRQLSRQSSIQNQLFQNSKGKADLPIEWNHMLALRSTYLFNGRWYLNGLLQLEQVYPSAHSVFMEPDIQSGMASFVTPVVKQMQLLSLVHKGINMDGQIDLYQQFQSGISGHHSFYHDYYNAFVYGIFGNERVLTRGIDLSLEKDWYGVWKTSLVGSFKNEMIANNPVYEIRNVNDMFKMESGQLMLRGLPYSNSAKLYLATTIEYKPNLRWQFTMDQIWSSPRPIYYNYFKRTNWVQQHVTTDSAWNQIMKVDQMPSVHVLSGSILRSSYVKQKNKILKWQWKGQVQYLLSSAAIPVFVNESSRFDYNDFSNTKFPAKWFMAQPWSVHFSILFQIQ